MKVGVNHGLKRRAYQFDGLLGCRKVVQKSRTEGFKQLGIKLGSKVLRVTIRLKKLRTKRTGCRSASKTYSNTRDYTEALKDLGWRGLQTCLQRGVYRCLMALNGNKGDLKLWGNLVWRRSETVLRRRETLTISPIKKGYARSVMQKLSKHIWITWT